MAACRYYPGTKEPHASFVPIRVRASTHPTFYQGMLLDGVALASGQMGALDLYAHPGSVDNSGTPIYQGLAANLEYAW